MKNQAKFIFPLSVRPFNNSNVASEKQLIQLWKSGADFVIRGSTRQCSIRDKKAILEQYSGVELFGINVENSTSHMVKLY